MSDPFPRVRRRGLLAHPGFWALAALPLLLATGWTGFWYYASGRIGAGVDGWMAREAAAGRVWACPERALTGFPLRFELSCRSPSLVMTQSGGVMRAGLSGLTAVTQLYQPNQMDIDLTGPLSVTQPDAAQLTLDAATMHAGLRANLSEYPNIFDRLSVTLDEPVLTAASPGGPARSARAARAEIGLRSVPGRPAADGAFDLAVKISGAAVPDLDALTQSADPAGLDLSARILKLDLPGRGSGAARLEAWRAAGGALELNQSAFTKGALELGASGRLALDTEHRLEGRVDASVAGADTLLKRFGIPVGSLDIGSALGNLLGGKKNKAPEGEGAQKQRVIRLPLSFNGGRVSVGPVSAPVRLTPLY